MFSTTGFSHAPTERQRRITRSIASVRNKLRRAPPLVRRLRSQTETAVRHAVSSSGPVSGPKSRLESRDNPPAQGQKTEPTAKLFDNQVLASESSHDFGRTWLRRLDHRRVNRCLFELSAHLHRRMPTIRFSSESNQAARRW